MRFSGFLLPLLFSVCATASEAVIAPEAKDVILFGDGEKLVGRLLRSSETSVVFHSDSAGDVTVPWKSVKELKTAKPFAVVQKSVKFGRKEDVRAIPQGPLAVASETIVVDQGEGVEPARVAVRDSLHLIDANTFDRLVHEPGVLSAWRGTVTAGASLVEATQQGRTFNGAVHLARAIPEQTWLPARNRTTLDFNGSYGIVTQPHTEKLKTELYHLGLEHDEYFTARFFAFVQSEFDHNFSQGLDLQQAYGGGIGWSAAKRPNLAIDLKASASYVKQGFQDPTEDQKLFGSTFAQTLRQRLSSGIIITEQVSVTPTWNNLNAYTASANAALTIPVYKRVSFTVGGNHAFINNPPPGFRKNSIQFTTGLTYTLP